uniref:Large subunit ribosomal protein L14e n=1 Tax=Tetraselmis sp. GSL018 TaxID=582737 RepID=A0A061S9L7_9CHLO|mmetsp:Transcript_9479/g.22829  ORF Transcript_9479/g.22829 Transcript_9479/m.22829 type:complete len:131 (-) Transcript_9479:273-665(-)|eukprot:CAMPEP_0177597956 /NCGR_PEP_ID=MMETSP0419_2-20121207/12030_1 /TAXON_ID=582737 /ORGANISM="Tetraselmis sp., Strain GSL018" /LENGTH=130 /DNA_ID=CAMNT_0019090245 /DNA_START=64 /DNA_END=456 /DNA_ORIENTATION=-
MPFTRNVEIGRLALVNYGPDYGKVVVISDVLDHHRALVDHPDQLRRVESFKRLSLTDFKIDIPRMAKKKVLKKALEESDALNKFANSKWGKKLQSQKEKASMTDFERFKAMIAKKKRNAKVAEVMKKMQA